MKGLFAFYSEVTEWKSIGSEHQELQLVFAETLEEISKEIEDTDIMFILAPRYTQEVAQIVSSKAKKLKWIQATTVGVDDIVLNGFPSGVILTKAVGIFDTNVAEQTMALLLALVRQVAASERDKQRMEYKRQQRWEVTTSLERKNVGIIGFGGIGRQVCKRAKSFDTRILVYDVITGLADAQVDEFFGPGQFEDFLAQCDVVILTLPQTKENLYLFDNETFKRMKQNCLLINVSRGKLIKESALVEALGNGTIAGAGLDVFEEEPLPQSSELWKMDQVVMTPHLGGQGDYNRIRLGELFKTNLSRYLNGEELKYVVDPNKGF
jgi:phosphoglycerate dehydrogenase-like enzyme